VLDAGPGCQPCALLTHFESALLVGIHESEMTPWYQQGARSQYPLTCQNEHEFAVEFPMHEVYL
jgi:hypothetical protein